VEVTKEVVKEVEKVVTAVPEPVAAPAGKRTRIYVHDLVAEDATGPSAFLLVRQKQFDETHPAIEVVHLPFPNVTVEKRREYWITSLSAESGGPSAVFSDNAQIALENASNGLLAELDPFLPLYYKEWDDVSDFIKQLCMYEGKVFVIPGNVEGIGYVVRNDYLTEAGYEERYKPKDWAEWETMVKKLTNDQHQGFVGPGVSGWMWMLDPFVDMNGGTQAIQKDDKSIELHYTTPENVEAVKYMHGLLHPTNYASKDPFADFGAQLNNFQQGLLGVFPFFPSWLNWLFGAAKFQPEQLNFYAVPFGPSAVAGNTLVKPGGWVNCHAYTVAKNQKPEEMDAAAQYVCYMMNLDNWKQQAAWFKENEIKGVFASPFKSVDWSQVSYGVPEWWGATLPEMMDNARQPIAPDYRGETYWRKAAEDIMRDPAANVEAVLTAAEETCKREWLDEYMKGLQGG
jgi:ABC-type glycerol-3-phosphate transport system substrate-binding protein